MTKPSGGGESTPTKGQATAATDAARRLWELSFDELAEHLRLHTSDGRKVAFLIGAGVSRSAGIPTAPEIAKDIEKGKFSGLVGRCEEKTYSGHMGCLPPMSQRELLMEYVRNARLNAAHLYLAAMVKKRLVERILTVNFDPLMVNALVYSNLPPYVYDIANLAAFDPKLMANPAVIHLHGQLGALINLHSTEQVARVKLRLHDVLQDTLGSGPLVVVGYSGVNDPVFDVLCEYPGNSRAESACFPHGLYWVQYEDADPSPHVCDDLLKDRSRYGHFVRGQDADKFFMALATKLGANRPVLIGQPFTFLTEALSRVAKIEDEKRETDLTATAQKRAGEAIACFEEGQPCSRVELLDDLRRESVEQRARLFLLERKWDEAELGELLEAARDVGSPAALEDLAMALVSWGRGLCATALAGSRSRSIRTLREALTKCQLATELKPDSPEAFRVWGAALEELGQRLEGEDAKQAFRDAIGKYQRATELKPESPEAFQGWGRALDELGQRLEGEEAEQAFRDAIGKYKHAAEILPDFPTFYNLGAALLRLCRVARPADGPGILTEARRVLTEASQLDPNGSVYNLACLEAIQGNKVEALRLLELALNAGDVTAKYAEQDEDFKSLRDDPSFKALIKSTANETEE